MTQVIIFDKDGTLMDYHQTWQPYAVKTVESFIQHFNLENQTEEIHRTLGLMDGKVLGNSVLASGTGTLIEKAFVKFHPDAAPWLASFYKNSLEELKENMTLIEGAKDVLVKLRQLNKKIVLLTSDHRESTQMFIDKFHLSDYIDDLICGSDSEYHKPDYEVIEPYLSQHCINIQDVVMIGDNKSDTMLGFDKGLYTIGVLSGTGVKGDLIGANMIINSVRDLIQDGKFILDADA